MAQKPRNNRWSGWFKKKPSILRPFPSMRLEELEPRDVPATYIWTGAGATPNWTNPANWTPPGGGAPSAPTGATGSPFGYDDLVFPDGPSVRSTVNDIVAGTFNSISFSQNGGAGYVITGNPLTLGAAGFPGTGFLNVASAASTNNDIRLNVTLGTSSASFPGNLQTFTILGGLTISGQLSGHISSNLIKTGSGELTLSGNNIGYQGTINLDSNSGTLVVKHPNALGDTSNGTTVGVNSILALDNVGGAITETLTLNGPGDGEKTLFNRAGNNTLAGPIVLGTADGTDGINFNAAAGTTLTINSTISDTGPDGDIFSKEGLGTIVLNAANTYRGLTKVNSGVLAIGNAQALGAEGKFENRTIVRSHPFDGQGQLRLADTTGAGFTIFDEWLELNGQGQAGLTNSGALTNTVGDNTWAGPVFLGSPAPDGVAVTIGTGGGTLTISGVISTPNGIVNGSPQLTKVDTGTLIFNNANTYACPTLVSVGKLIIRDSQSLGTNTTTVSNGATLELQVEAGAGPNGSPLENFDAHGRNLSIDSVTGDAHRLQISNVLNLTGLGMLAADGTRIGALYSQSGINVWTNTITSNAAGIGVALDPRPGHPTPDSSYFVNDYSLTTIGTAGAIRGSTLTKLQRGHLILPVANSYNGRTFVQAGWITAQDNRSLGARDTTLTQTTQPETFVYDGAAVHFRTLTPSSPGLVIDENFILSGVGPKLPYKFISQKGALMNIGGDNVLGVDSVIAPTWSTYVALNGNVGIGVEQIAPLTPGAGEAVSRLTMLAWTRDDRTSTGLAYPNAQGPTNSNAVTPGGITKLGSGLLQLEGEGTFSLDANIKEGEVSARHNTALGQSTSGTYSATSGSTPEVYNQTNTIVQTGANLLLDKSNPLTSGGISSGIQTAHEQLVLNGAGQQIAVSGFLDPAPTQFFLTFTNQLTDTLPASTRTTAGLQSGLTAADMEAELNKLPSVRGSEIQSVSTGAIGNFTLTFNGQTTTTPVGGIPAGSSAAVVQNALLGLSTIRRHEIQTVTVTGGTIGTDTFILTFNGQTTAPIPVGASALQVQTALSALPNIGACTVVAGVVPGPGTRYTVTFDGPLVQYTNLPQMTALGTGLTSVVMATQQEGFGGTVVVTAVPGIPSGVVYTITFGGELANRNVSQITGAGTATVVTSTIRDGVNGAITVSESVGPANGNRYTLNFLGDLANADLPQIVATAADGTLPTTATVTPGSAAQSEVQRVDVVAAEASYILHYKTQSTNPIPITAPAQLVENELNGLSQLVGDLGGQVLVSKSGNVYSAQFNTAHSADVPSLTYTSIPTPQGVPEVTISGSTTVDGYVSQASLISLSEDNTWRGPVVMNSGGRIAIPQNTRINFLGSISDGTNANPAGSDLVKRGQGEILLGALNSFRGTAWIDEGYATIANSGALGTVTSGTVVANKAQFQIQGSLTVAGEPLTIQGTGVVDASTLKDKWFNVGPASTNGVVTAGNQTTSARITSVTTDPRDANVIYIATAGGGAWKSKDHGITWNPLFDDTVDTAAVMYGGSIVVAPSDPNTVYFATGEANGGPNGTPVGGQRDGFAGTGVYVSNNAGLTWRLLTGPNSSNPVYGLAVSKLIVDPVNPQRIYVATGTSSVINGGVNQVANNAFGTAVPGVYRYDGSSPTPAWMNLTGNPSLNRATVTGQAPFDTAAPNNAGPDDDYRIMFPQNNATWSDIALVAAGRQGNGNVGANTVDGFSWVLYAALGESQQRFFTSATSQGIFNAVYRTEDPANAFTTGQGPTWWIGNGTVFPVAPVTNDENSTADPPAPDPTEPDGHATSTYYHIGPESDPVPPPPPNAPHAAGRNEWIKLSVVVTKYFNELPSGTSTLGRLVNPAIQVYATNGGNSVDFFPFANPNVNHTGEFLDIQRSGWDGGIGTSWTQDINKEGAGFSSPPFGLSNPVGNPTPIALGRYDSVLISPSRTFGLVDTTASVNTRLYFGAKDDVWSVDGIRNTANPGWVPFTQAANSPADYFHALHVDKSSGNLLIGSDGGLWNDNSGGAFGTHSFQNMNGNIAAAQINNIDPHPTDINQALAAAYNSGLQKFNGGLAWNTLTLPATGDNRLRDAGDVRYDPSNPQNAWAVVGGNLYRTQNGGTSWQLIRLDVGGGINNSAPVYVDPLNPSRILVGGSAILETRTGSSAAPTFTNINGGGTVAMAPAVYQGQFVADPGFPNVTDHLANSADPDTIYVTDGNTVRVTKNRGLTWIPRNPFQNVSVYNITFGGSYANIDVQQTTVQATGGASGVPSTIVDGSAALNEIQSIVVTGSTGQFRLRVRTPQGQQQTAFLPVGATNQQVQDAINNLPGMLNSGATVVVGTGTTSNVITDIAVDPSNRDTVYITVRQRDGTLGQPAVYRTTDAGQTWVSISSNASSASAVSYTNSTPVSVADDNSVASSSVTVTAPAGDSVSNVTVTVNITMPRDRDLSLFLRGPNGLRIPLSLNRPSFGPGGSNFINTTFSDAATTAISAGTAPFTGLFKPESPLSGFNGSDPIGLTNGVWTLEVQDNNPNGITATINDWTLDLTTAPKSAGDLPFTQTWTVAVDPRTDTIYVGNDQGVWRLPNASSTTSYNWSRYGDSLPDVQVHDIVVNQTLNTITASTYGRGMYQLLLTDYQPSVGGIRIISGNSIWTGPITLTGDLTITADGTQEVQNGIAVASLDILGTITDSTPGNASVLTKKGLGTVMLSAANTYGGQTLVQQGVLRVKNPSALGMADADSNTVVADGAALELASDLRAEPVLLNGDGFLFNGHYAGAMRSIGNNNVYTGPVTFGSNVTIGVDRGNDLDTVVNPGVRMDSSLRIGAHPNGTQSSPVATATTTSGGAGVNEVQTITLPNTSGYFNLTFGTATTGLLPRNATAAQVAFALNALSSIGGLGGSVAVTSAVVGSGIQYTVTFGGALANTNVQQLVAGESALTIVGTTQAGGAAQSEIQTVTVLGTTGAFNLTFNSATTGVLPASATAAQVQAALNGLATIGGVLGSVVVTSAPFGAGTQFTITFGGSLANTDVPQLVAGEVGSINDGGGVRSLDKELGGTLILASANVIGGQTNIIAGAIRVEDAKALGSIGTFSGTKVTDGAAIQLARNAITLAPTIVTGESLSLSGTGQDVTGALRNVRSDFATTGSNDNTWAGPITFAQNPGSNPQTNPGSRIAIRVDDSRIAGVIDTLNIDTNIQQDSTQASFGLIKVGPGRLNLMQANSFTGTTEVGVNLAGRDFQGGSLRIENPNSLGPNALSNSVQVIAVDGLTGTYTLSFLGQTTATLNAATSTAQDVENALNNLSAIGLQPEQQTIATTGTGSYTLTFDGQQTVAIPTGAPAGTIQAALQSLSSVRRPEIQDVMVSNTAGYFTLTYQGQRTAPLPFNTPASGGVGPAASVENALNALSTILPGSVTVVALPGGTVPGATVFRVTFSGNTNRAQIVSQTYTSDTVQDGAAGNPEIQRFALFSTAGTFTISFNGLTTIPLAWNATLLQISDAINALPSVSGVNGAVVVTEAALGSGRHFTLTFTGSLSDRNLPEVIADGVGGPVTSVVTVQDGLNGSATVTGSVPYTVTFGGDLANRDVPQIVAGNFTGTANVTMATSRPGAGVVVSETPGVRGRVFTVTFQRPLDLAVIPQLVATPTSGLAVNVTTAQVGGQGAIVNNTSAPATLEIAGDPTNVGNSINVIRNVVLNGTGVSGSIRVASASVAGGTQYTLTFDGALGNTDVPLVTAVGTGGAATTTAGVTDGSRASNEIQRVTVTGTGGTFTIALNGRTTTPLPFNAPASQVQAALAAITSLGGTAGALSNVSGNNVYSGTVTLGTNTQIGATPNTQLTVLDLRDPTPLTVAAPTLTKVGQGTIVFPTANSYGGQTTVRDGVLNIRNPQGIGTSRNEVQVVSTLRLTNGTSPGGFALTFNGQQTVPLVFGAPASGGTLARDSVQNALNALSSVRRSEVQTVTLSGSATGSFFMVFNGQQTVTLPRVGLTAGQVQSALEALPAIGVGNVLVTQNGSVFTLTFQATLANKDLSPIVAVGQAGTIATAGVLTDGLAGTATVASDVIPGGVQYTITFSGDLAGANLPEVLVTSALVFTGTQTQGGGGLNEVQTVESLITTGQSFRLTFNGQTTAPITAPADAVQIKNALEGITSVKRNEVQDVIVTGTSGTFTIQVTTPDNVTTTTQPIAFNATAATVQTELTNLTNIGVGNVSVTTVASPAGSTTYRVTFQGTLGNRNIQPMVATRVGASQITTQVVTNTEGLNGSVSVVAADPLVPNLFSVTFTGDLANTDVPQMTGSSTTTPGFITSRTGTDGNGAETQYLQVVGSNGTFRLSFRGQTTGILQFFATAADVENALNALSTIGGTTGGFVTVTKAGLSTSAGGAVYTIHFGGTLGVTNLPAITTSTAGGITTAAITTGNDGPEGTRVLDGATLQLQGNMTMDREVISLNGQGFMNMGALNQTGGTTTWQALAPNVQIPLFLESDSAIGTTQATDQIVFQLPITDAGASPGKNLDIYGPGTIVYTGSPTASFNGITYTQYTGTTTVHEGTLLLSRPGFASILGPLVVGDGKGAANTAVVRETTNNQIADGSTILVNADGLFDLNTFQDTVGDVTVVGGHIDTGIGGQLTAGFIDMTGGLIDIRNAATVTAQKNITMRGATIQGGLQSTLIGVDLDMNEFGSPTPVPSVIDFGNKGVLSVRDVTMAGNSTIDFDDDGAMVARDITAAGGHIGFLNKGSLIASGNVSGTGTNFTFGQFGLMSVAGSLSETNGTISFGFNSELIVLGDASFDNSKLQFANEGTATVGGKLSAVNNSRIDFGDTGSLTVIGDATLTDSDLTMGDGAEASTANLTMTRADLSFGAAVTNGTSSLTSKAVVATDASLVFGDNASFTADSINATNTVVDFGQSGLATVSGNVDLNSSTIHFDDAGRLDALDVTGIVNSLIEFLLNGILNVDDFVLTGNSKLQMDKASATASTMDLTNSSATFGPGSIVTVSGTVKLQDSSLTVGSTAANPSLLQTGDVSMDPSYIVLGDSAVATLGDVDAVGGSVTGADNVQVDAGNITSDGTDFIFGNNATMNADTVSVKNAKVTFGTDGTFATTGNMSLDGAKVTLGDRNLQDPVFSTQSIDMKNASVISLGSNTQGESLGITMAGSTLDLGQNAIHKLGGDVIASSTATDKSQILGPGTLDMNGSDRNFDVMGPLDVDLLVTSLINSSPTERLVKTGAGRLEFAPAGSGFSGPVSIFAGDVQVDTQIGEVNLKSTTASLSGVGTVGQIDGALPTGDPAVGTVAPGVNWSADPYGVLNSGAAFWGPSTTFSVNIRHISLGAPIAGVDNDLLASSGAVSLNGAKLAGFYDGAGVQLNDQFTIITAAGGVTGKFAQTNGQDIVFIDGHKFTITYNANSVVLNKVQASIISMDVASNLNPATQRQPVVLTATMVPESGAGFIPTSNTVKFTFTNTLTLQTYTGTVNVTANTNQATFNTSVNLDGGFTFLPGGSYTVLAEYSGDPVDFLPKSATLTGQPLVIEIPVFDTLTASEPVISPTNASSIGVKDSTSFTVNVINERGQLQTWSLTIQDVNNPSRTLVISNPTSPFGPTGPHTIVPITAVWNGMIGGTIVSGDYTVTATFLDVFGNTGSSNVVTITVDDESPTITSFTNDSPNGLLSPNLSGLVTPQVLTMTGTVGDPAFPGHPAGTFQSWTIEVRPFGTNTVVRSITGTNTSVNATWDGKNNSNAFVPDGVYTITIRTLDGAGNNTTSSGQTIVVLNSPPTITPSSNSPTIYGNSITITAVVSVLANDTNVPNSIRNLLVGDNVEFYLNGATLLGSAPISFNGTQYVATYTTTASQVVHAGIYNTAFARYTGSPDFTAGNSPAFTHVVQKRDLHIAGKNPVNKVYGDAVPPLDVASGNVIVTTADLQYSDTAAVVLTGSAATTATNLSHVIPTGYPITQGTIANSTGDYNIVWTDGRLFVTKKDIVLTIDDKERPYHAANPPFTFTGAPMANGELAKDVVSGITLTTTATSISPVGSYPIFATGTPTAQDYNIVNIVNGTLKVTPIPTPLLVGAGQGAPPLVNVYSTSGTLLSQSYAFTPGFKGGVRVASGDFNRDGVMDYALGTGPGTRAQVRIINGATKQQMFSVFPFNDFTGGVYVAAGDIDGDGADEVVITPDEGGGPRVVAYSGLTFQPFISFFGIQDPNFRGGARAAVGDLNGDGYADIAVSAGFNGGPRISLWDGKAITNHQFKNMTNDFFAYDKSLRNGAYVAIGDVDGDGKGDLITGAGPGGGPHVKIFNGAELLNPAIGPANATLLGNFFAGNPNNRGGVRVAVKSFDSDLQADVVTGVGAGGGSSFSTYLGKDLAAGVIDEYFGDNAFPGYSNGVYVG